MTFLGLNTHGLTLFLETEALLAFWESL